MSKRSNSPMSKRSNSPCVIRTHRRKGSLEMDVSDVTKILSDEPQSIILDLGRAGRIRANILQELLDFGRLVQGSGGDVTLANLPKGQSWLALAKLAMFFGQSVEIR